jgi:hypothetical protein
MKQDSPPIPHAILELAHRYAQRGEVHQAVELYFRLLQQYPATREATEAGRSVLEIAQRLEAGGKRRGALSLYLKLAACSSPGTGDRPLGSSPEESRDGGIKEGGLRLESHGKGHPLGPMGEIPFVDLTRPAKMKRNFERLGSVKRTSAEISRAVARLRKLAR